MKLRTAYDPVEEHDHCGIEFTMPSLTVQDEKDETDINYIVNKYADGQKGIMTLDLGDSSQYAYCSFPVLHFFPPFEKSTPSSINILLNRLTSFSAQQARCLSLLV